MTEEFDRGDPARPDHEAIRAVMHRIRSELSVADRARLAVGLVGHLATRMSRRQMALLLDHLREEVRRVHDAPPREPRLFVEPSGQERWLRP